MPRTRLCSTALRRARRLLARRSGCGGRRFRRLVWGGRPAKNVGLGARLTATVAAATAAGTVIIARSDKNGPGNDWPAEPAHTARRSGEQSRLGPPGPTGVSRPAVHIGAGPGPHPGSGTGIASNASGDRRTRLRADRRKGRHFGRLEQDEG